MAQLVIPPKARFVDSNGDPLVSGKLYSYEAGTSTPLATYTDKAAGTPNANPVILDSRGEADVWLSDSSYKFVLKDSDDVTIWTVDDVKDINDDTITTAMIQDDAITTAKIADNAVTNDKLATGIFGFADSAAKTEDYTATLTDEIILVDAIAGDVIISLPSVASAIRKVISVKRTDDHLTKIETFVDGDVTVANERVNIASHTFIHTQIVQLTTSGTLPAGLALATDYYIIYIDANNIQFASSKANAELGTAVDITAAAGGGTHTITSVTTTVTIDAYLSETIDDELTQTLIEQYQNVRDYCDGIAWFIFTQPYETTRYIDSASSGYHSVLSGAGETAITNLDIEIEGRSRRIKVGFISDGSGNESYIGVGNDASTGGSIQAEFIIKRDGVEISRYRIWGTGRDTNDFILHASSSVSIVDNPGSGTFNYVAYFLCNFGTAGVSVGNIKMYAHEI